MNQLDGRVPRSFVPTVNTVLRDRFARIDRERRNQRTSRNGYSAERFTVRFHNDAVRPLCPSSRRLSTTTPPAPASKLSVLSRARRSKLYDRRKLDRDSVSNVNRSKAPRVTDSVAAGRWNIRIIQYRVATMFSRFSPFRQVRRRTTIIP